MAIRGESIKYGASKKKKINDNITKLESDIQTLEDLAINSNLTAEQNQQLTNIKIELDQIICIYGTLLA